jgi:Zn-dependent M28 family amino/carboxypeptidase
MKRLSLALTAACLLAAGANTDWNAAGERWWSHVKYLASDELEGRNVGSAGFEKAARYVATEFERAGLAPAGSSGYTQPVKFTQVSLDEGKSSLSILRGGKTQPVELGAEAILGFSSESGASLTAPLVFVGYGLSIPEAGYDDFTTFPVKGSVVVFLSGGPSDISGNLRSHYSSAEERWKPLRRLGAVGWITIPNPGSMDIPWSRQSANRGMPHMSLAEQALAAAPGLQFSATWNPDKTDVLFDGTGHSFAEIVKAAAANQPLPHFALNRSVIARVTTSKSSVDSENIAGLRSGTDPKLKDEYVVISAHLDHLGVGEPVNGDRIFNGAMDDASGVASVIEIARAFEENKIHTSRSILFLVVTGEEKGLQGSRYFAYHPTVKGRLVADINMDMFLPLFPLKYLEVQGLAESTLGDDVRAVAEASGVQVQADKEPNRNRFIRSDQYSFIKQGVPSVAFKFGYIPGGQQEKIFRDWYAKRYHAVGDDLNQPVDKAAAAQFNAILSALALRVANANDAPSWKADSFFRRFRSKAGSTE